MTDKSSFENRLARIAETAQPARKVPDHPPRPPAAPQFRNSLGLFSLGLAIAAGFYVVLPLLDDITHPGARHDHICVDGSSMSMAEIYGKSLGDTTCD